VSLLRLSVGCWDYDRVAPLRDGRVSIDGVDAHFFSLSIEELFYRVFRSHEFDVCEMSLSSYMMAVAKGAWEYYAVPVFPSRMFRHSAIFVCAHGTVREPGDLRGKRVGVPEYAQTAAVTARGVLADEFGVEPTQIHWFTGGLEEPGRHEKFPLSLPEGTVVTPTTAKSLNSMLLDGEIDALISARDPSSFAPRGAVVRLFRDHQAAERDYFQKTGVFPIMHMLGVRRRLLEEHRWLAVNVVKAFTQAKDMCIAEINGFGGANLATVPWMADAVADARALMGEDYWPYGLKRNRAALKAATRWSHSQGLTPRLLSAEELFAPSTLGEVKV